ncbi:hypothetical protein D3C84_468390 [compost metagenome]
MSQGIVHRREVARHHLGPLAGITLLDALLDQRDRFVPRQHPGQREEAGLHDGVDAIAHAVLLGHPIPVDAVELDIEGADTGAQPLGQLTPHLVSLIGGIEQQGRPFGGVLQQIDRFDKAPLVAADKARLLDKPGRIDGLGAKAQVGDGARARLLGVVDEVALGVEALQLADDLDAVLVGADRAVGTESEEQRPHPAGGLQIADGVPGQTEARHVIDNSHGKAWTRCIGCQLLEHRRAHGRGELFGRETVAAATEPRQPLDKTALQTIDQRALHIQQQRLAAGARLLGAIQHRHAAHAGGQRIEQRLHREGAIETNDQHPGLAILPVEPIHRSAGGGRPRAHQHDHIGGIGCAMVLHQLVVTAGQLAEAVHALLYPRRHRLVEGVDALAGLEIGVGVLGSAAHHRMIRVQRPRAVGTHPVVVDKRPNFIFVQRGDLVHLVGGTEPVEEVDEGHPTLQGDAMGNQRQILRLLHRGGSEHGKTGAARRHHILMVTKDRQPLGRQRAGRHMEHRRGQFAGDLVHIRQHQHQPLTGGEGGGERPRLQGAVYSPGRPPFALHLHHCGDVTPQVGLLLIRPGVGQFGHGRARGDGVNGTHFAQLIRHPGRGFVAVDHDQFMFHWDSSGWRSSMA